ncbi:hypothetical protein [Halobacillus campisalis]|uniref:Uncharacterized protein n=1 Tax=Halobacillus campisalis TaxID=435909 RepID=A0ABW2K573_9BACI
MDAIIKKQFDNLQSKDKQNQYDAFTYIMEIVKQEVDWANEVWNQLLEDLDHNDPHRKTR